MKVFLLGAGDPVVWSGLLIGAVAGYYMGLKARMIEPSAPLLLGFVGGVVGAAVSYQVFAALCLLTVFVGIPVLLWFARKWLREWWRVFANAAGGLVAGRFSRQSHQSKVAHIEAEHRERLEAIYSADIPRDSLEKLLEQERRRFDGELQGIGRDV